MMKHSYLIQKDLKNMPEEGFYPLSGGIIDTPEEMKSQPMFGENPHCLGLFSNDGELLAITPILDTDDDLRSILAGELLIRKDLLKTEMFVDCHGLSSRTVDI